MSDDDDDENGDDNGDDDNGGEGSGYNLAHSTNISSGGLSTSVTEPDISHKVSGRHGPFYHVKMVNKIVLH